MKRSLFAFLALALLTGCTDRNEQSLPQETSEPSTVSVEDTTVPEITTAVVTENETEEPTTETPTKVNIDPTPAYRSALEQIYYACEAPLFGSVEDPDRMISDNHFAVYDIDLDGRDELIFYRDATAMAGMLSLIYDVDDSGELRLEFQASPLMHYYSNGIITIDDSHNQGISGNFWPYTLCEYDADSDTYDWTYNVSAWDGEMFPEDYEGNPFPSDADLSDTGFVYYIYDSRMAVDRVNMPDPVDKTVFDEWYDSVLGGAKEVFPEFYTLTEENIAAVFGDGAVG